MGKVGVSLEEPELAALLKVSSETGNGERVYGYLHKLRNVGGFGRVIGRANVDSAEQCGGCREQSACVDIDDAETERFAQSVAALALESEVKANFKQLVVVVKELYNWSGNKWPLVVVHNKRL
uniref:PROP1-like PPR domain-containing protein n=1 Tax=Quercus lobata TaxID=97700 RepID=A0A7N2KM33_QUELO